MQQKLNTHTNAIHLFGSSVKEKTIENRKHLFYFRHWHLLLYCFTMRYTIPCVLCPEINIRCVWVYCVRAVMISNSTESMHSIQFNSIEFKCKDYTH